MNIINAKKLVGQLERLPDEKFAMNLVVDHEYECGTKACIAGWCALLNGGPPNEGYAIVDFAEHFLDLSHLDAQKLFWGDFRSEDQKLSDITRADAIAELNRMIAAAEAVPS